MATIGELKARAAAAQAEADEAAERLRFALAAAETSGAIDSIEARGLPEYRLLTNEQAIAAAVGGADPRLAREIEEEMRAGMAATDAAYRENEAA